MSKPISVGQIWLLEHMVLHDGFLYVGISTWNCPESVGMNTLRGLEKRGFCEATNTSGVFAITDAGRRQYDVEKSRLVEAKEQKRQRELAQLEEEEKMWQDQNEN
jgi:DNA-binding PadR family transcriptional regulator